MESESPVCIQVMSDLHLEDKHGYEAFMIWPRAPYLALLGNIGNTRDDGLFEFLEVQLVKFQIVFFVFGHEERFYSSFAASKERLISFQKSWNSTRVSRIQNFVFGEFVFLDQTRYDITSNLTILGCSLFLPTTPEQAPHSDIPWLKSQLATLAKEDEKRDVFVMTHHRPVIAQEALPPRYTPRLEAGFDLGLAMGKEDLKQVKVWAFGHTQGNGDHMVRHVRFFSNQRGYYFKPTRGFNQKKVVSL